MARTQIEQKLFGNDGAGPKIREDILPLATAATPGMVKPDDTSLKVSAYGTLYVAPGLYSLAEIDTGTTWIDGRKIYRKVVNTGALPNNTSKLVPHGVSTFLQLVQITCVAENAAGLQAPLSMPSGSAYADVGVDRTSKSVRIWTNEDFSSYSKSVTTVLYTKS